ncbi:hypothetical protein GCM10009533_26400 [Saccharopolyspora spinosporotrichia]|uniref:Uncharacterized protein n=1 Tax=Saccharopolyspora erythraea TaxID=1836 RepID=A0ABP3MR73_SACER
MSACDGTSPGSLSGVPYLAAISARCRARSVTASASAHCTCWILMWWILTSGCFRRVKRLLRPSPADGGVQGLFRERRQPLAVRDPARTATGSQKPSREDSVDVVNWRSAIPEREGF